MNKNIFAKKTKIVATIGPVTENEKTMTALAKAGMDVIRLNFSHGDFVEHGKRVEVARKVSAKLDKPIAILQDLAGPKIRIGEFYKERVHLKKGSMFTLTTKKIVGDETKAFVNYKQLPKEVKKGDFILLDDGKKKLQVLSVHNSEIKCKVIVGGETKGRRGVNVPGVHLRISAITEKDKKDLEFGIKHQVDFIALSFVRQADDIVTLRKILRTRGADISIIAKIETSEAIQNIDSIIEQSDGIMIARGDLAIEVPTQDVPILQKMIIDKCNHAGKPVITATQMLESMIKSPVPTRAEVSDVANSILDGTDAVMLSEETTLGDYPVQAVTVMSDVAIRVEGMHRKKKISGVGNIAKVVDAVSGSVVYVADKTGAKVIVALTESGFTARMISRFKPSQPIVVMSPYERACRKMALSYGCYPVLIKPFKYVGQVTEHVGKFMIKNKLTHKGDKVVIAAGVPFGKVGGTNMLFVHEV
ncbi:MAG: pyruvate kinase [Patescibacteria group bacterium]